MKKRLSLLLVTTIVLTLTACSSRPSSLSLPQVIPSESNAVSNPETTVPQEVAAYEITYSNARTWTNSIGSTWVQTIVEIENTGTQNLYLSSGSYDLEDATGTLIAAQTYVSTYPDVIAPGEKGYMYEETILDDFNQESTLTVLPRPDVKEATVDLIRYDVSDVAISNDPYSGIKVLGRVENNTDETDNMVYIVAFFYDSNNTMVGSAFTILTEDLMPGSKIGFEINSFSLPDDITAENIAETVVYAYPMQIQF